MRILRSFYERMIFWALDSECLVTDIWSFGKKGWKSLSRIFCIS